MGCREAACMATTLTGFVVGVTADRRSEEQIALLEGRGARCIHGPTIRTHPVGSQDEMVEVTRALIENPPDAVVVQTGIGIRAWAETAEATGHAWALRKALAGVPILCRGQKAVGASIAAGLEVAWFAEPATADAVAQHVSREFHPGARIAVQNDGAPEPWLANELFGLGFDVVPVNPYSWAIPQNTAAAEVLVRAIVEERVDAVTFTSRPAVENLLKIAEMMDLATPLRHALRTMVIPACVGPVTAAHTRGLGLGDGLYPARYRLGAMVQQLTDALVAQARPLRLGGHDLVLRGRSVEGLAEPAQLAGRERAVLLALLDQPGVVHSKRNLLDEVWKSTTPGTHTVEVTVGRLRRRLGPAGKGIETVTKRGYRLRAEEPQQAGR